MSPVDGYFFLDDPHQIVKAEGFQMREHLKIIIRVQLSLHPQCFMQIMDGERAGLIEHPYYLEGKHGAETLLTPAAVQYARFVAFILVADPQVLKTHIPICNESCLFQPRQRNAVMMNPQFCAAVVMVEDRVRPVGNHMLSVHVRVVRKGIARRDVCDRQSPRQCMSDRGKSSALKFIVPKFPFMG